MLPHAHYLPSIRFAPRCEDSTSAKLLYMPISLHGPSRLFIICIFVSSQGGRKKDEWTSEPTIFSATVEYFENVSIGRRPNRIGSICLSLILALLHILTRL